jgi:Mitochondrial carrier protein
LTPSLLGNALSWGMYWVAWKSLHGYHCTRQNVPDLSWNMKLLCGMQAGAPCSGQCGKSQNMVACAAPRTAHNACAAGVVVTLVTNPVWVVKTRMQLESTNVRRDAARRAATAARTTATGAHAHACTSSLTFTGAVRGIYTREGGAGFYRGLGPALLLCSHGAIQILAYEELKKLRLDALATGAASLPHGESLVVGAAAKLAASAFTYPLQVTHPVPPARALLPCPPSFCKRLAWGCPCCDTAQLSGRALQRCGFCSCGWLQAHAAAVRCLRL